MSSGYDTESEAVTLLRRNRVLSLYRARVVDLYENASKGSLGHSVANARQDTNLNGFSTELYRAAAEQASATGSMTRLAIDCDSSGSDAPVEVAVPSAVKGGTGYLTRRLESGHTANAMKPKTQTHAPSTGQPVSKQPGTTRGIPRGTSRSFGAVSRIVSGCLFTGGKPNG